MIVLTLGSFYAIGILVEVLYDMELGDKTFKTKYKKEFFSTLCDPEETVGSTTIGFVVALSLSILAGICYLVGGAIL